jgi:hypothetical protein
MNRQVVPSMILSVLIVCFFSILLHESDEPLAGAAGARSVPPKSAAPDSPSATSVKRSLAWPTKSSELAGHRRRAAGAAPNRGTLVDYSGEKARSLQPATPEEQSEGLTQPRPQAAARHADSDRNLHPADSLPEEASQRVTLPRETEVPR